MSKPDADRTIMTRLERSTHARLNTLRAAMQQHALLHPDRSHPNLLDDRLSLSEVVDVLIDRYWAHRRRSVNSKANTRRKRAAAQETLRLLRESPPAGNGDDTSPKPPAA